MYIDDELLHPMTCSGY